MNSNYVNTQKHIINKMLLTRKIIRNNILSNPCRHIYKDIDSKNIDLLKKHLEKIDCGCLQRNPNAIPILEKQLDTLDWYIFSVDDTEKKPCRKNISGSTVSTISNPKTNDMSQEYSLCNTFRSPKDLCSKCKSHN